MQKPTAVVAVTGGMGCGQSSVCEYLAKLGVKVINADLVARKEIEKNEDIKGELKHVFGKKIFYRNGKLNRKLLARIAFSDETKTWHLNNIVHPQMVSKIIELIEEARDSNQYNIIAIDAALIYELNLEHMFDAVIVVSSKINNRVERIKRRDRLSEKEIMDRMSKQIPLEDKAQWADFVVNNDGDLETLEKNTQRLYSQLRNLIRKTSRT